MLKGIGVSKGYGIGKAFIVTDTVPSFQPDGHSEPAEEAERFSAALRCFTEKNTALAQKLSDTVGKSEGDILLGHIMMMQDPYLCAEIEKAIIAGKCAEEALSNACDSFIAMLCAVEDEFTRQRADDIKDIKSEMLRILTGEQAPDLSQLEKGSVLIVEELTPSMTARIDRSNIAGLVAELGAQTSHAAILAEAMGIPAVLGVPGATERIKQGEAIIVDGFHGNILLHPSEQDIAAYTEKQREHLTEQKFLSRFAHLPTETADGKTVALCGNIGSADEAEIVEWYGGEGIGLFRTEFLFMDRSTAPDEKEQFEAYKKALLSMNGKQVIIRTLDIGGDKVIPYLPFEKEENPFLGFRAIRYCLAQNELFLTQLRALVRASDYGKLAILLPFITEIEEYRKVKALIAEIMRDFDQQGIPYDRQLQLGVMIETPAAAICANLLAKEADFFSIGSNDLIGYTLAADRGNAKVNYLYSPFSPAVLRLIRHVCSEAEKSGISVGICGEAAADPMMIPLLLSFGIDKFSVAPTLIWETRREIAGLTKEEADKLTAKILTLETESEVKSALTQWRTQRSKR